MLSGKVDRVEETKKGVTVILQDGDATKFAAKLERFFAAEGYRLEDGSPQYGTYAKGSGGVFAIMGALSNRMKFKVQVLPEGDMIRLMVNRGMSGMWGGLIGKAKVTNEFNRVTLKIRSMLD